VLTPADEEHHVDKHLFKVPFVCGCRNLGEALRRIGEGAAMIRTKGEAGTGDVVEAVRHARAVLGEIRRLTTLADEELMAFAKELGAPYELQKETKALGRLPVVNFAAGGIATPADAALMMQLGGGRRIRGLGDLQVGRPGPAGQGHRRGHHPLPRREDHRRGQPQPGRAHGGPFGGGDAGSGPHRRARLVESMTAIPGAAKPARRPRIGVLALQGDFAEHIQKLALLDASPVEVRLPKDLVDLDGLIIPGGESTTIGKLAVEYGLLAPLRRLAQTRPIWGTCAGAIFLSKDARRAQPLLGVMAITMGRNAFGRQLDSFEIDLPIPALPHAGADHSNGVGRPARPFHAIFIRAPLIERVGPGVEVLATLPDGRIVAARQGNLLATSFHPELTPDDRFHRYFLNMTTV